MGQIQSIEEFLSLLIRRRLLIASIGALGAVLAVLYALTRPVVYEATSVIQVETPTVTDASGAPVVSVSAQRLQSIQQRLTTRDNLLAMIDRHSLYDGLPLSNDEKVHLLRQALRFQTVASVAAPAYGAPPQVSALLISTQADDAAKAARLSNDVAQSLIDASVEGQTGRAREAYDFFTAESQRLNADLAALDAELAAYRDSQADALPSQRELGRDEIVGIEADLRALDQQIVALGNERDRIAASPTLRETDRRQIATLGDQVQVLTAQRHALATQREALAERMARIPAVEQALDAFERRREQIETQATIVTERLNEADTARKLEERQQAERFTLLERAVTPELPVSGGRKRLAMVGMVASVILGVAVAFVMDLVFPVVRTAAQMKRQLDLQPVVSIPELPHLRQSRAEGIPTRHEAASSTVPSTWVDTMRNRLLAAWTRIAAGDHRQAALGMVTALGLLVVVAAIA